MDMPATGRSTEHSIREKLGIPDWADKILVVAESTHWDPDWLLTSNEYYRYLVRRALEQAVSELQADERRVFDVECIFFLRMFWERGARRREVIRDLVNTGRMRLTGSGVTTPDTLLPNDEALIRDLLTGLDWLRSNGMTQQPGTLYLPDSFGHSPALPSLLASSGIGGVAFSRIDGAYFLGIEYAPPSHYPRPGSSAKALTDAGALDFRWIDAAGSEVIAHWNAFTYGHGDMIAGHGIDRAFGLYLGIPDRSDANVRRHIERYVRQLEPLSPTPYMLLALGIDFSFPLKGLVALLDRYNENHGRVSGIYAVNAGLDDYIELVRCHSESLPVIEMDPNPLFTGFYSSRLPLKRTHRRAADALAAGDAAAVLSGDAGLAGRIAARNGKAWEIVAAGNHHDFITGTSTDRVYAAEQRPWLAYAEAVARESLRELAALSTAPATSSARAATGSTPATPSTPAGPVTPAVPTTPTAPSTPAVPAYHHDGDVLTVETPVLRVRFDLAHGGTAEVARAPNGKALLDGGSFQLTSWRDSGGMWRMGNEFAGGRLQAHASTGELPARVSVREERGGLEVELMADLASRPAVLSVWIAPDEPLLVVRTEHLPGPGTTTTLDMRIPGGDPPNGSGTVAGLAKDGSQSRIETSPVPGRTPQTEASHRGRRSGPRYRPPLPAAGGSQWQIVMAQPGGIVVRPHERHYSPTFWPLTSWACVTRADLRDDETCETATTPATHEALARAVTSVRRAAACAAHEAGGAALPRPRTVVASHSPTGLALDNNGALMLVAGRNPGQERAFELLPFLGFPVHGHERERSVLECAIYLPAASGDAAAPSGTTVTGGAGVPGDAAGRERSTGTKGASSAGLADSAGSAVVAGTALARRLRAHVTPSVAAAWESASRSVEIEPALLSLMAAKPASDGRGAILRFEPSAGEYPLRRHVAIRCPNLDYTQAFLCDAMERDLGALPVSDGHIRLDPSTAPGPIITLRLA